MDDLMELLSDLESCLIDSVALSSFNSRPKLPGTPWTCTSLKGHLTQISSKIAR